MEFDTSLSLEFVLTILAILGAIWRLEQKFDRKMSEQREEFKADNVAIRSELTADIVAMRSELKADNVAMRGELKDDNIRLADKIDDGNQRLARLEGIILAREDLVGAIAETTQ